MVARKATICIFLFSLAVVAPTLYAHNATIGEYWQKRAEEARKAALDAYHPNPFEVTHHLNLHVHRALEESTNSTRKIFKKNDGPCEATNPIDRCWRCEPYWANNRKKLADCVQGFGRNAKGGQAGRIYTVTDASDDPMDPKPGTLRHAVIQKEPLWIIFSRSMIIRLKQELILTSYKTIDGRGAAVHIAYGAGITVQFVRNVIIHGLYIHDIVAANGGEIRDSVDHIGIRTASDGDGISVFGSVDVWIDHISMYNCTDGLIDVIEASTAITISNCHMTDHNDVMLFGASDAFADDKVMQITVAFNHFGKGLVQRMPRCRWGFVHVLNNDYTHWLMYAIGGSRSPTIISQGNRFIAPPNDRAKEVTKREYTAEAEWKHWLWKSENDMMVNGAFFVRSGDQKQTLSFSKNDMITAKPATFVRRLTRFSGAIPCTVHKPC